MNESFGNTLLHFSYACDLIDEDTLENIRDQILDYTNRVLEIEFDRFLVQGYGFGNKNVLLPYRSASQGNFQVVYVEDHRGEIMSLSGYAFTKNKPLWVVSADSEFDLRKSVNLRDLWSNEKCLPKYWYSEGDENTGPIRTSILIPVGPSGKVMGVQTYETRCRLDVTKGAKDELQKIAKAMYNIYQSYP